VKKVSVIIPTYKRSNYLIRAVESVLSQTYQNVEIIVVDDNDEESEFRKINEARLKKYIDSKKIIYLKHLTNKNGAAARNTGIKRATGDYITFLDDDDFFLKERLEIMVEHLERNANYLAAYTGMIKIRNGSFINYRTNIKSGNFMYEALCQNSFFGTGSNMMFRKEAINKIGLFDEKFLRYQDMEYMLRFFEIGEILGINKILVVKCAEDSINQVNYEKLKRFKKMYINKFKHLINKIGKSENDIYYNIFKELYIFTTGINHLESKNIILNYGKIKYKRIREKRKN